MCGQAFVLLSFFQSMSLFKCTDGFQEVRKEKLLCHLSPSRSLVFLLNDLARFAKDGWLVSKGLCVPLHLCIHNFVSRNLRIVSRNLRIFSILKGLFPTCSFKLFLITLHFGLDSDAVPLHNLSPALLLKRLWMALTSPHPGI